MFRCVCGRAVRQASVTLIQAVQLLWRDLRGVMHPQPPLVLLQLQVSLSNSTLRCLSNVFSTCTCTDLLQFANAGIRLAGATSDVHIMDVRTGKWEKMVPHGEPPSPRAAHAAAAVGSMVVVQVSFRPADVDTSLNLPSTAPVCLFRVELGQLV